MSGRHLLPAILYNLIPVAGLLFSLGFIGTAAAQTSEPDQVIMQLRPQRCVALHQGQQCYQTLRISWQSLQARDLCLFIDGQSRPLTCWRTAVQGEFRYEFKGDRSLTFLLLDEGSSTSLAEAELEVAWVYSRNTRRKSHWRIF